MCICVNLNKIDVVVFKTDKVCLIVRLASGTSRSRTGKLI